MLIVDLWCQDSTPLPSDPCDMQSETTNGFQNRKSENISGKIHSLPSIIKVNFRASNNYNLF